ncbi:alpha/beta fold hydrolase [Dictyobacter kobayashii]|uniref:Arylesterase n=1 Tax=Dictyobacter kobayashii TaxID=2014872 RepID=A0A402AXU9_9CHLR|nr:alpha/beta hydrolase [Dictyobacter kobayashii]GCE23899.1 arylesterase [Dictyobacter kobayashii]
MSYFESHDGTRLFYEDWGTGAPIVFVSSWALNSDMWEYQIPPLVEQGFRCITLDRRGHGRSDRVGHGYDFDTLADDLAALITHLDLHNVTLVGHSTGGCEVIRYLSRHGSQRIARIGLIAAIAPFLHQTDDNPMGVPEVIHQKTSKALREDRAKYFAHRAQGFFAMHLGNEVSTELVQWMTQQCQYNSPMAILQLWHSAFYTDFRAEMREITVPTLIIHGTADASALIDITGRRSAQLIPGNTYKEYPNAGHGLFITHKEHLTNDLLEFIRG